MGNTISKINLNGTGYEINDNRLMHLKVSETQTSTTGNWFVETSNNKSIDITNSEIIYFLKTPTDTIYNNISETNYNSLTVNGGGIP